MPINIFQNYYLDPVNERQEEIDYCRNINNRLRDKDSNVFYVELDNRPTFNTFFYLTQHYPKHINIIANSDIYFDIENLNKIEKIYSESKDPYKLCLALTRWDVLPDGQVKFMNRSDSQDTWVFYGSVPQINDADFYVGGVAGCDNKIAYLLDNSDFKVFNPSKEIITYHLHNSAVRNYLVGGVVKDKVLPPYKTLEPCTIDFVINN